MEVARHGKAVAALSIWKDEEGFYFDVGYRYSSGGMGRPVMDGDLPHPSFEAAKAAGIDYLLEAMTACDWESQTARSEISALHQQLRHTKG